MSTISKGLSPEPSPGYTLDAACPCGSGVSYAECCAPLHQGAPAESVEALMRSRFTAFVLHQEDYLRWTWHPDTCPVEMGLSDATNWKRLEVLDHDQQQGEEERRASGWVHFRATFKERGRWQCLEEVSNFTHLNGRWLYVDGDAQVTPLKPGRNDSCPCGSGRKLKRCCAQ